MCRRWTRVVGGGWVAIGDDVVVLMFFFCLRPVAALSGKKQKQPKAGEAEKGTFANDAGSLNRTRAGCHADAAAHFRHGEWTVNTSEFHFESYLWPSFRLYCLFRRPIW